MLAALTSPGPNPQIGNEAQTWDRFVGTWDADFSFHRADGAVQHKKGEVRFGWVLDGNAIQDVWITDPPHPNEERSIGTSLRFFDKQSKQWRVVFLNPRVHYLVTVHGGMEGDRIVLNGNDTDGALIRWSFNEIKRDSFVWRGETSRDHGRTWALEEEHHMRRRAS